MLYHFVSDLYINFSYVLEMGVLPEIAKAVDEMDWT